MLRGKFNFALPYHRAFCKTIFPKPPNILKYFGFPLRLYFSLKENKKVAKSGKIAFRIRALKGEMAERPIAAVLKTVEPARVPGVQIPLSPFKI